MADVKSRRDAIQAEMEELWKTQAKLMQEFESTSSAEIKVEKMDKYTAIFRQLEPLNAELTAISKDELALIAEARRQGDERRKMLQEISEESNKRMKGIWR